MKIRNINAAYTQKNIYKNSLNKASSGFNQQKEDSVSFRSTNKNNKREQPKWTYAAMGALILSLLAGAQADRNLAPSKNKTKIENNTEISSDKTLEINPKSYEEAIASLLDEENSVIDNSAQMETEYSKKELETLKRSKTIKLEADKDYREFIDKIWENFPQMYAATKELSIHKEVGDNGNFYYVPDEGFAEWYDSYENITKIQNGENIWQDAKTANDAVRLIREAVCEAGKDFADDFENRAGANASAGSYVNTGEYNAIMKLLDGLSDINNETRYISDVYREELEKARNKTKKELDSNNELMPLLGTNNMLIKNAAEIEETHKKMYQNKTVIKNLISVYKKNSDKEIISEIIDKCHDFANEYNKILKLSNTYPSQEFDTREIYAYMLDEAILNAELRLLTEQNDIQIEAPYIFYPDLR